MTSKIQVYQGLQGLHRNNFLRYFANKVVQYQGLQAFFMRQRWPIFRFVDMDMPLCYTWYCLWFKSCAGGVSERFKEAVLKTVEPSRVPWVRIPLPPPGNLYGELAE